MMYFKKNHYLLEMICIGDYPSNLNAFIALGKLILHFILNIFIS
jgi:hypothetical protein